VRTRPDVVLGIHRAYLEAGSDVVETNSFGGTKLVLAEYGLADDAYELNFTAAKLARQAADEFSRFVAGSMGPTTKAITVTGGVTFPQLVENFYQQASALVAGGADILLVETCQDTRNVKAALLAIERLRTELGRPIPTMVSAPSSEWAPCSRGKRQTPSALRWRTHPCFPLASTALPGRSS